MAPVKAPAPSPVAVGEGTRALVCLLPGLGDALTSSSVIRALRDNGADVDVLTMLDPIATYAKGLDQVREVFLVPLLHRPRFQGAARLISLRKRGYNLVVLPFPATRWQYMLVARLVAAGTLVSHRYGGAADLLAAVGRRVLVPILGGHRVWENARLVHPQPTAADVRYLVPARWRSEARAGTLGIHPGTMKYKGNEVRRWSPEFFSRLAGRNLARGRRVRIFLGPCEDKERAVFEALAGNTNCELITAPLEEAARKLSECQVFVGNDAGFSHLASGLGVNTLVLFGMTDPVRALPIGHATAVRPSSCPPCHDEGLRRFDCAKGIGFRCIGDDLRLEHVDLAVERAFAEGIPWHDGVTTSAFQLYGRRHGSPPPDLRDPLEVVAAEPSR